MNKSKVSMYGRIILIMLMAGCCLPLSGVSKADTTSGSPVNVPEQCWNEDMGGAAFVDGLFKVTVDASVMTSRQLMQVLELVDRNFNNPRFPMVAGIFGKPANDALFMTLDAADSTISLFDRGTIKTEVNSIIKSLMKTPGVTVQCSFGPYRPSVTGSN